jgi:hypothetical protein
MVVLASAKFTSNKSEKARAEDIAECMRPQEHDDLQPKQAHNTNDMLALLKEDYEGDESVER